MHGRTVRYPDPAAFDCRDDRMNAYFGQRLARAFAYIVVGAVAYLAVAVTVFQIAVLIRT